MRKYDREGLKPEYDFTTDDEEKSKAKTKPKPVVKVKSIQEVSLPKKEVLVKAKMIQKASPEIVKAVSPEKEEI